VWLEKTQETLALARRGASDQIVVNALVDGERGIFLRPKRLRKNRDRNNPRLTRGALRLPERSGEGRGSVHDSATETQPTQRGREARLEVLVIGENQAEDGLRGATHHPIKLQRLITPLLQRRRTHKVCRTDNTVRHPEQKKRSL
jgi:hypothetical protein